MDWNNVVSMVATEEGLLCTVKGADGMLGAEPVLVKYGTLGAYAALYVHYKLFVTDDQGNIWDRSQWYDASKAFAVVGGDWPRIPDFTNSPGLRAGMQMLWKKWQSNPRITVSCFAVATPQTKDASYILLDTVGPVGTALLSWDPAIAFLPTDQSGEKGGALGFVLSYNGTFHGVQTQQQAVCPFNLTWDGTQKKCVGHNVYGTIAPPSPPRPTYHVTPTTTVTTPVHCPNGYHYDYQQKRCVQTAPFSFNPGDIIAR